jgi:predicted enzyme related to lactoylglutathione lyase
MTTMTSYAHGVPSWIDLATPDPAISKKFYGALFGWHYDDQPTDNDGAEYTMADLDGQAAAGMMQLSPDMAESGMPPVWTTYVTVDDIDEAVGKVEPAGGSVMQPPMDAMPSTGETVRTLGAQVLMDATEMPGVGTLATLLDPTGAAFSIMEPTS